MKTFKPTQLAPLPYKGAPRDREEIMLRQARIDEQYYPHLEYTHPEEVLRKELPTQKYSPISKNWFQANVFRTLLAIMP